jgi:heme/copper-type cytochrome/quinol oxidase subunit 2
MSYAMPPHSLVNGKITVHKINIGWIISSFLIGALAFVTALQWQTAFRASLESLQERYKGNLSKITLDYISAAVVTVFTIIIVILVYFCLRNTNSLKTTENKK